MTNQTQATAPAQRELVVSIGESRKSTVWRPVQISWEKFVRRLSKPQITQETVAQFAAMTPAEKAEVKDVGGFVGGAVRGGSRKASEVKFRQLLALDADYASPGFWDDFALLNDFAAVLYSTHSHTKEHPRLRLLIPLARPVQPDEYEAVGRLVAQDIGIDQFDDTTYEPNRLMYWPSVSQDGEYAFEAQDGDWLDPDEVLARYANWKDASSWPVSSRQVEALGKKAEKQGSPVEKPGIVGAFCRVYDVPAAIERFLPEVYEPAGGDRYTHVGSSTVAGAVLYDDGAFLYSNHATDPHHGKLLNAFDLVRLHLYGEMDAEADPGCAVTELPSYKAMKELCQKDEAVVAELRSSLSDGEAQDMAEHRFVGLHSDQDIARMMADKYTGKLMFHESLGWMYWDGAVWRADSFNQAVKAVFRNNNELLEEARMAVQFAADAEEKKRAEKVLAKVEGLRSAGRINGLVKLLQSELPLKDVAALDPEPWILNTPDCLVDLRTGTREAHDPGRMCSHITAVTPEKGAHPMWTRFLKDATLGDEELERYLQMVAGMAAVGQVYEEGLVMVYGPGGNGKSTMFGTLMAVLGDYAATIRSAVLIDSGRGSEPYGLDEARGRRMVLMSELDEGARMSVSTMKSLTSRDEIQCNPKYAKTFRFVPTHKLILHTNHLPRLGQLDFGTRRRVAVVPFECPAKEGKDRIPDLSERMVREEGPQILQWIVEGARMFYEHGCSVPKPRRVTQATDAYIKGEDWLATFLDEKCVVGSTASCSGGALYEAYRRWAEENKEYARRNRDFTAELETRGYEKTRTKKGAMWTGIGLAEEEL